MPDVPKTEPTLPELATKIKSEHARLMDSGRYLVQHAISIGEDLLKAKAINKGGRRLAFAAKRARAGRRGQGVSARPDPRSQPPRRQPGA